MVIFVSTLKPSPLLALIAAKILALRLFVHFLEIVHLFSLVYFNIFSLYLVFINLGMICLGVSFYSFFSVYGLLDFLINDWCF